MLKLNIYIFRCIVFTLFFIVMCNVFGENITASINISSSLPESKLPSIIAGHSFTMTATSINRGAGEVYFTATDPGVKLNPASCIVNPNGYCQVTVTVTLGTPPNLHDIVVDYQGSGDKVELTRYRFRSINPQLEIVKGTNVYSIRKNKTFIMGFTLGRASIPEGEGVVKLNLSYTPEGVIIGQQSCDIEYADNKIINNKCRNLPFIGTNLGVSQITVTAEGFTSPDIPYIVVPNKFVYVLSANQIIMLGVLNEGRLISIDNHETDPDIPLIPVEGNPVQMVGSSDDKFLYVIDQTNNMIVPYAINADTGEPVLQSNLRVATGNSPNKIVFSSAGDFAYVTNYASSTISQYIINKATGALIPNTPATVSVGLFPVGIVTDPKSKYAYVNYSGSKTISKYSIDSKTGKLAISSNFLVRSDLGNPKEIAINPTGGNLLYISGSNVAVLYKLDKNGNMYEPSYYTWFRNCILTGLYFNPVILPNGTNLGYYIATTEVIINQINKNGSWSNTGTLLWADESQNGPDTMAFDPSGKYAYIGHSNSKTISMYSVDINSNGNMITDGTVSIAVAPLGIVVQHN